MDLSADPFGSDPASQREARAAALALLAQAESARGRGALAEGLRAADEAWAAARLAGDEGQCRRAGLLRVHFHYRSGALAAMQDVALQVLPLVRRSGPVGDLFDLLRQLALAGCDTGRFETALPCAQEAHALALQMEDRGRTALAINALACCFERMGDPWQAERLMRDALELARGDEHRYPLFVTLNNLSAVLIGMFHLLRDAASTEEIRATLLRALEHAREAHAMALDGTEPFHRVFTQGNLGETLVYLERHAEARPLLEEAQAISRRIGSDMQTWRIACTLGELALAEGRHETAWQALQGVLSASQRSDAPMTHLRLHHALWRAGRALQRPAEALHHLEQYLLLERQRALRQLRAQSELMVTRTEIEQVQAEARRDQLTRLGNRREVAHRLPHLLATAQAMASPLAMAMVDLDHFKHINDRFGHAVGDSVLVVLAGILRDNTRSADLVARVGGEEFLLVLTETPAARALEVCERLRQRVASFDWTPVAPGLTVTLSVGLTAAPPYEAAPLTARADAALYRAKAEGRNRVVQA